MTGAAAQLRRFRLLSLAAALALVAAACANESQATFPEVVTLGEGKVFPGLVNHTVAVGPNRLSFTLSDRLDRPVEDADVRIRFFELSGEGSAFRFEADARSIGADLWYLDEEAGGARRPVGRGGVYIVDVAFDRPGRWGALLDVRTREGARFDGLPFQFDALEGSPEPAVGAPAPPARQPLLADVGDPAAIDTSRPFRTNMHDTTVADALAAGEPLVVVFASPAYSETRTGGPMMETVIDPLYARYGDRAAFIHIEPYDLEALRERHEIVLSAAAQEWGLRTEPWVFVVGRDGRIVAKFEGLAGLDEVEAVLREALARS